MKRFLLAYDDELHGKIKVAAARKEQTMSDFILEALEVAVKEVLDPVYPKKKKPDQSPS